MTSNAQPDRIRPVPRGSRRGSSSGSGDEDLSELRTLLMGEELAELTDVRSRFEHERLADAVGDVLPDAIERRTRRGERLAEALTPSVERAMRESVRRDPHVLVDALFPVMGPAIRKAVAAAIGEMVQALNRSLEHSFSIRGLKWRVEAARTGRSYAEVVLLHSLVFRVEQLFLIHSETGLLLQHVVRPGLESPDGELVSGMLTAIQDFVRDSLGANQDEGLEAVRVGALTIWIERGPHATIAGVLRGEAPAELRHAFQDALSSVHLDFSDALEAFEGDAAPFDACRPRLEQCFQEQYDAGEAKPSPMLLGLVAVLAFVIVAAGATMLWHRSKWNSYLATLRSRPGVVVTENRIGWRKYEIAGLRDPFADDPADALQSAGIDPADVNARWETYASYAPELVGRRAAAVLAPPTTVALRAEGGTLALSGLASHEWIESARSLARMIPGVARVDLSNVRDLDGINAHLESTLIRFESNSAELAEGQEVAVADLATLLRSLQAEPEWREAAPRIEVVGHTDSTGTESVNARLSEERAERIIQLPRRRGRRRLGIRVPRRRDRSSRPRGTKRGGRRVQSERHAPRGRRKEGLSALANLLIRKGLQ